jgi:cytochrome b subunit of formate dehydrogenase
VTKNQDYFVRFSLGRRIEHWVWLVTFVILAATGLPQKFSNAAWAQDFVLLLGGIESVRFIHRVSAATEALAIVYHAAHGVYMLFVKREQFSMLPTLKDVKDVITNVKYFLGLGKTKARYDRFSYIEKFDYWAVFWGIAVIGGSGLVLWFPSVFTRFLPGAAIPIAKAAHSDEALLAVLAIFIWHMYNAHISPRVFPINTTIFTGRISKERMIEEHPLEYQRLMSDSETPEVDVEEDIPWITIALSGVMGAMVVGFMGLLLVVSLRADVPHIEPAAPRLRVPHSLEGRDDCLLCHEVSVRAQGPQYCHSSMAWQCYPSLPSLAQSGNGLDNLDHSHLAYILRNRQQTKSQYVRQYYGGQRDKVGDRFES